MVGRMLRETVAEAAPPAEMVNIGEAVSWTVTAPI
jgi:hypothetical protein